jgi:hypothetical protein
MTHDPREMALAYIDACGRKDLDTVASLLAPEVQFVGPSRPIRGAPAYLDALRAVGRVWVRSDVMKPYVDGAEVCVIYDIVTDTAAGAVAAMEWLRFEKGKIASITLIYDRVAFAPAAEEIKRRGPG